MACSSHTDHFIRLFRVGSGFRDSLARTLVRLLEIEVICFSDGNYTWSDSCGYILLPCDSWQSENCHSFPE